MLSVLVDIPEVGKSALNIDTSEGCLRVTIFNNKIEIGKVKKDR